ncbi:MAG: hypothetical protein IPL32_17230 [Chloracidobacterium sp.]|nr:hypothetical protein [Chloracidobacterium sp.]
MAVWKFGVHFGGGNNPSHYDFIKEEGIAIGHRPHAPFSNGDLVIITDGFTVKAIVGIVEEPWPITDKPGYAFVEEAYNITYGPDTIVAKAEWYDFPFWYQLVRAGNQVHDPERIRVIENIWNNR